MSIRGRWQVVETPDYDIALASAYILFDEVGGDVVQRLPAHATGQRAVASTNATVRPDDLGPAASAALDVLAGATALLVDGHHLSAALVLATDAHRRGIPVLLDGGSWKPGLDRLLAQVDVAVLSGDFRLPGHDDDTSDALLDGVAALGPSVVARSSGSGPVRVRVSSGHDEVVPSALPPGDVVDRHRPHLDRGQLDRQRQAVEPGDDLLDAHLVEVDARSCRDRAAAEQLTTVVRPQPAERVDPLRADGERAAGGGQHGQVADRRHQEGDQVGDGRHDVLAVVEHEQGRCAVELLRDP